LKSYDELKLYVIKHSLYREAIELYKHQAEQLRDMIQLYADYLHDQSNYKEAAIGEFYILLLKFSYAVSDRFLISL
jgi:elongator complex protein 1